MRYWSTETRRRAKMNSKIAKFRSKKQMKIKSKKEAINLFYQIKTAIEGGEEDFDVSYLFDIIEFFIEGDLFNNNQMKK